MYKYDTRDCFYAKTDFMRRSQYFIPNISACSRNTEETSQVYVSDYATRRDRQFYVKLLRQDVYQNWQKNWWIRIFLTFNQTEYPPSHKKTWDHMQVIRSSKFMVVIAMLLWWYFVGIVPHNL